MKEYNKYTPNLKPEDFTCLDCEKFMPINKESTKIEYCVISDKTIDMNEDGEFAVPNDCPLNIKIVEKLSDRFNHLHPLEKLAIQCNFGSTFVDEDKLSCYINRPDIEDLRNFIELAKGEEQ